MKKKVTLLVAAIMVLATIAAYAGTATIDLNVTVTLPTYLSVTLTDLSNPGTPVTATATTSGSMNAAWEATGTPGPGVYAVSSQYKLNVVCNDTWATTILLADGKLTRTGDAADLTVEEAHGAAQDPATFAAMTNAEIPTASGSLTAGTGVDSFYLFRVPYTWTQRAGVYTGKITFSTVSP